ncbi:MAG: PEP-CTERM sorting domain-containing protein, partial [Phycisphaerae bacterium]|nr:PEP-CTERM sorting domain-containing protein [Phycisphaerae bacterium]
KMKFTNWDTGTLYGVDDGLYETEATLDGLLQVPPPGRQGNEDTWGVFRLDSITDPSGTIDLWNRFTPGTPEITGIFWGARDVYLDQTTTGAGMSQDIHGVGMSMALFEDAANNLDPYPAGGIAAARTAPGAFDTFTDGTLIWTMNSVPGHDADFPEHEFFTKFWPDMEAGAGQNAAGGVFSQMGAVDLDGDGVADDVGSLNWWIIKDNIDDGVDFTFEFTGEPDSNDVWLVISDDPARTAVVPEPITMLGLFLGIGGLGGYIRKRRQA